MAVDPALCWLCRGSADNASKGRAVGSSKKKNGEAVSSKAQEQAQKHCPLSYIHRFYSLGVQQTHILFNQLKQTAALALTFFFALGKTVQITSLSSFKNKKIGGWSASK